tara:strand:- start:183 stop:1088 length:906 start_codon:yes stop_codon:yes gene_type:complete
MSYIEKNTQSPLPIVQAIGGLVGGIYSGIKAGKASKKADKKAKKAQQEKKRMQEILSNVDTSNPFQGMTNPYAGLENTMEDLTVNKQEADFQAQQFQQSQANIMSGLKGSAGSSGIAALAQTLAQQSQLASQKSSASIGKQEAANQAAAAREAGRLQTAEARGDYDVASSIAQGEAASQQRELTKQKTLYDAAQEDHQFAQQQQASTQQAKDDAWSGAISSGVELVGSLAMSDRKLKKNIKLIGKSPSGLKIYAFEYIDKFFGEHVYQGVMSDEIPSDAVINNGSYDKVDYSKIDVEFKIL